MEFIDINSGTIAQVGYSPKFLILCIVFHRPRFQDCRLYFYLGVQPQTFTGLLAADNPESFFTAVIKGKFQFVREWPECLRSEILASIMEDIDLVNAAMKRIALKRKQLGV